MYLNFCVILMFEQFNVFLVCIYYIRKCERLGGLKYYKVGCSLRW